MSPRKNTNVRPAHQERSREKRDRLIKAGICEFGRHGYGQTRMADVAREAGVSVGVLYQRFKDKRGFFEVIVDALAEQLSGEVDAFFLAAEAAESTWDLPELIEQVVASLIHMVERDVGFFVALITVGDQVPGTLGKVATVDRHRAQLLHGYAVRHGLIDPAAVDESRIYFALATAIRMLLVTATVDRDPIRLRDSSTRKGLAAMLTGYLQPQET